MAQSEIPVAWIGLGGMVIGAVATADGTPRLHLTFGGAKAPACFRHWAACPPPTPHQARGARTLAPDAHISVRALYRELGDAVDDFSRALKRLARRGLGVI
ncbi:MULTISPECIES: hypothetical protein [unclassified Streptomyces]|uniref:hypothetical protein n=1 Tax=unclassified Streptomyces TaxID=2593676 RepID=UPI001CC0B044|nr:MULTISPECIES: hypothetical protein [unclassified Streptomyces]WPO71409.1 hypothetical protein R9806_12590 [Streptomyces sp. KN37]